MLYHGLRAETRMVTKLRFRALEGEMEHLVRLFSRGSPFEMSVGSPFLRLARPSRRLPRPIESEPHRVDDAHADPARFVDDENGREADFFAGELTGALAMCEETIEPGGGKTADVPA